MGIKIPGYRISSAKDMPELRRRLKGNGKHRKIAADLTLTSMIDVFSVIILFLMNSFSATGNIFVTNPSIKLPEANHGQLLFRAPIITVQSDKVTLEGAPVGENAKIDEKLEESDWDLPLLTRRLDDYKKFFETTHPNVKFPTEIIIQSDKGLPFVYVKRVLFTLTKMGFVNINFAVRGVGTKAPPSMLPKEEAAKL